jgi:hypothetical protein
LAFNGLLIDRFAHLNDWAGQLQFLAVLEKSGDTQRGRNPATLVIGSRAQDTTTFICLQKRWERRISAFAKNL